jgi:cation transport regulator ChaB
MGDTSVADLPVQVRRDLPEAAQSIFAKAHSKSEGTPGRALLAGWSAVAAAGYREGDDGRFEKIEAQAAVEHPIQVQIKKVDADAQVFYGWASVVENAGDLVVDHDGDDWLWREMEQTAFNYCKSGGAHGVMHEAIAESDLIASMPFTPDLQKALGIDLGRVGWLVAFRVNDESLWKRIKSGELSMLSIGASGFRTSVV